MEHNHNTCSCGCHSEQKHEHHNCGCNAEHQHKHEHEHHDCGCHSEHKHEHRHDHHDCDCGCGSEHSHEGSPKQTVLRLVLSAILLFCAIFANQTTSLPLWAQLLLYLPAYFMAGYDVLFDAVADLVRGRFLGEAFLMCIATVGALTMGFIPGGEAQFSEAVFVMIFFKLGQLLETLAGARSRRAIESLMDIRPDFANVERQGETICVAPNEVEIGETILVRPGERIPLDGVVIEGASALDTVALTGESRPRDVDMGDEVCSGCVNLSGLLRVRVTRGFGDSTATKIVKLVRDSSENKAKSESFIRRFARWYTPAVVIAAILLATLPPLISGDFTAHFATWFLRALTFLVVSCPCALVISVPLTFFAGIGGASRRGILIKGGNYIESLSRLDTVVLDKTGTLTEGSFEVSRVCPVEGEPRELLRLAALAESYSTHPVALSLLRAYGDVLDPHSVSDVTELAGRGVTALVEGRTISVGNSRLMGELGINCSDPDTHGASSVIHVAEGRQYLGHIFISDAPKDSAEQALRALEKLGIRRTVMLTGDRDEVAAAVATDLSISEYHAELLPTDKVEQVESLLGQKGRATLAFVGDGINDAPVLARADVGIAMGAMGSDAAVEAADVVLMDDDLTKLPAAISLSRRTVAIARQNIVFAVAVKLAVLVLTAFGLTPMWLAVFSDVGVMLLAVVNAMRAMKA